jgi:prepilin-type N-terminal cleavage/methylation domain-containing protein
MKLLNLKNAAAKGFGLVELLTVIAVIGVTASIAVPHMDNINANAKTANDQVNAQGIISLYRYGAAAGVKWAGAGRTAKIRSVLAGASLTAGAFAGQSFKMAPLNSADLATASRFIGCDVQGDLFYDTTGAQPSS